MGAALSLVPPFLAGLKILLLTVADVDRRVPVLRSPAERLAGLAGLDPDPVVEDYMVIAEMGTFRVVGDGLTQALVGDYVMARTPKGVFWPWLWVPVGARGCLWLAPPPPPGARRPVEDAGDGAARGLAARAWSTGRRRILGSPARHHHSSRCSRTRGRDDVAFPSLRPRLKRHRQLRRVVPLRDQSRQDPLVHPRLHPRLPRQDPQVLPARVPDHRILVVLA